MGFEVLFEAGRRFAEGVVEPRAAGSVHVPSGRIVVGDPSNGDNVPLLRRVPPGRYPATISVACLPNDDHRVAAAMLRFRAGRIASWEPAVPEDADPDASTPDDYYGFGVDSGLACFADVSAPLPHDVHVSARGSAAALADSPECAGVELPIGGVTISVFSAKDGTYASYWGLDATGEPVVLVTDFRVVGAAETRAADLLVEHWPGASSDEEITRNWDARDIAPRPAPPATATATATATASASATVKRTGEAKAAAKPRAAARKPSPKSAARKPSPKPAARKPSPKPATRKPSAKPATRKPSPSRKSPVRAKRK